MERNLKHRLYFTPYQYESPAGKYWCEKYGFPGVYTLYVFDMNGQTIQMLGLFFHFEFYFDVPMYNKQWCYVPCGDGQQMGQFDPAKIYREDTAAKRHRFYINEMSDGYIAANDALNDELQNGVIVNLFLIAMCVMMVVGIGKICKCIWQKKNASIIDPYQHNGETRPLL